MDVKLSSDSKFAVVTTADELIVAGIPSGRVLKRVSHPAPETTDQPNRTSSVTVWKNITVLQTPDSKTLLTLLSGSAQYGQKNKSLLQDRKSVV